MPNRPTALQQAMIGLLQGAGQTFPGAVQQSREDERDEAARLRKENKELFQVKLDMFKFSKENGPAATEAIYGPLFKQAFPEGLPGGGDPTFDAQQQRTGEVEAQKQMIEDQQRVAQDQQAELERQQREQVAKNKMQNQRELKLLNRRATSQRKTGDTEGLLKTESDQISIETGLPVYNSFEELRKANPRFTEIPDESWEIIVRRNQGNEFEQGFIIHEKPFATNISFDDFMEQFSKLTETLSGE